MQTTAAHTKEGQTVQQQIRGNPDICKKATALEIHLVTSFPTDLKQYPSMTSAIRLLMNMELWHDSKVTKSWKPEITGQQTGSSKGNISWAFLLHLLNSTITCLSHRSNSHTIPIGHFTFQSELQWTYSNCWEFSFQERCSRITDTKGLQHANSFFPLQIYYHTLMGLESSIKHPDT